MTHLLCKNFSDFPARVDFSRQILGGRRRVKTQDRSPLIEHASVDIEEHTATKDNGSSYLLARRPER